MTYDEIPLSLNGRPVIHAQLHSNCATVLVEQDGEYTVATWWPELQNSWSWGHYYRGATALAEAQADFDETAQRNADR